jgi:hypothetical protein
MVYVALTMSGHMLAYKMDPVSRNLTFVESVYIDRGTQATITDITLLTY